MSSEPVVKGLDGMTLVRTSKRTSRQNGESVVYRYEGPLDTAVTMYEANRYNSAEYDDVTLDREGGKGVVELVVANPDNERDPEPDAVWELDSMEVWVPLLSAEYFENASGVFRDDVIEIESALARGVPWTEADADPLTKEWAMRYYGLRAAGVEGFSREVPVIRKTYVASRRQVINIDFSYVGQVVPFVAIGVPSEIGGSARVASNLAELPVRQYASGDPDAYTVAASSWEWLARFPRLRSIRDGRQWEVSREWWGQWKWSKVLYGKLATWDPQAPG